MPASLDAEHAVLGSCFLRPEIAGSLDLEPRHFFGPRERLLWEALQRLAKRGDPIDELTVADELGRGRRGDQALEAVGGLSYIGELAQSRCRPLRTSSTTPKSSAGTT